MDVCGRGSSIKLQLAILPPEQRQLWQQLAATPSDFVLYGDTALALQLGHRQSVDCDFFSARYFVPEQLHRSLPYLRNAEIVQIATNTLSCLVSNQGARSVKLSFFGGLQLRQLQTPHICAEPRVALASLADLSATKVQVIQNRAEAKDYLDIVALLNHISLGQMLANARAAFGNSFNPLLSLKALAYYQDGDLESLSAATRQTLTRVAEQIDLAELPPTPSPIGKIGLC